MEELQRPLLWKDILDGGVTNILMITPTDPVPPEGR